MAAALNFNMHFVINLCVSCGFSLKRSYISDYSMHEMLSIFGPEKQVNLVDGFI